MNFLTPTKKYLSSELFVLFVVTPLLLVVPIPIYFKIFFVVTGFVYVLFLLYFYTKFKITKPCRQLFPRFLKSLFLRSLPIIIFGLIFVKIVSPESFFRLITQDFLFWLRIVFVYTFISVIPQEIIYRNFFFKRYRELFSNQNMFLVINAFLFSISHMFLKSWIVLGVTFIGGLAFALSYQKTHSTWLVSLEHSLYGLILFTIGIGSLLAFPA